jgi:hypothetical protein
MADQIIMEAIDASAAAGQTVKLAPPSGSGLDITRGPFPNEPA